MALTLNGTLEIGAHVRSNLCYHICLRHLIRSRVTYPVVFPQTDLFSFIRAHMSQVTIQYNKHGIHFNFEYSACRSLEMAKAAAANITSFLATYRSINKSQGYILGISIIKPPPPPHAFKRILFLSSRKIKF